ncbi:hypothetical protein KSP39_PZI009823 [Platanthera zijinensis]|uniref:Protein SLOW GREEN 1, chloroplastic n=1 Tax=Platanthera zijinensis TaxID=2320716 RepID=A0AAP0BIH0_9ASPA
MECFPTASSFNGHQLLFSSISLKHKSSPFPKTLFYPLRPSSNSTVPRASSVKVSCSKSKPHPLAHRIKTLATGAVILSAATAGLLSGRLSRALAEAPQSPATMESSVADSNGEIQVEFKNSKSEDSSPLSVLLESNTDAVDALRSLLYQKLEEGEDSEALSILRRLMVAQPAEFEWKFVTARLLNEMGKLAEARQLLDEILAADPLSFKALFENAVLMDRSGEGGAAIECLERTLEIAQAEQNKEAARDVRLILAQIHYLQRNVDAALSTYDELAREDPKDYRPYFCQGVIYTLLGRDKEAREKFAKYNDLSEKKAEVNAYLQTPLSRVKLFGTGD